MGANISPILAGGLAGAGALAGAFPTPFNASGSNSSTTNSSGEQSGNFNTFQNFQNLINTLNTIFGSSSLTQSQTASTSPNLSFQAQGLIDNLIQRYQGLSNPSLTGYAAQQATGINQNADLLKRATDNIMASRGLSTSPVAGTVAAQNEANRLNQQSQLNQSLPLLQNQLAIQNLQATNPFVSMLPGLFGSKTTSSGSQLGTQQQESGTSQSSTGSQVAGGTSYGSSQNASHTTGVQQQSGSQGGGIGSAISGGAATLISLLPFLGFSDKKLKKDIHPIDSAIDKIRKLKPVSWDWKDGSGKSYGVVAQEIEKVLPELVRSDKVTSLKQVEYSGLIPYLIGAVQDLDARVGA